MCTLDDIQYLGDVTEFYGVDSHGNPMERRDHTDMDFRSYECECGASFEGDEEDAWKEVLKHLGGEND